MSGYDIKKTIRGSIGHFWDESYGQIYPLLKKMVAQGWADRTSGPGLRNRERHVYALTDKGRERLRDWLREPIHYAPGRVEILLKLFFGGLSSRKENLRHLEEFHKVQLGLLEHYHALERSLAKSHARHPDLPYWRITLHYGQRVSRALLGWSEETRGYLERIERRK